MARKEKRRYNNIRRIENRDGSISWQIDFTIKAAKDKQTGEIIRAAKRIRKSYSTLTEAQNALTQYHPKFMNKAFVDPGRYDDIRLRDLIKKYESVYGKQQRAFESKLYFIKRIRDYFGGKCILASITYDRLQRFRNDLIDSDRKKHPRSELPDRKLTPATVNRIMACLRHMLTCASEQWDMMLVNPFQNKPSLMLKENNLQKQFLNEAEIKRLLAVSPQHLQDVIIAAINSGMRRTELLTLTWNQIKWNEGIIELPETKSGEPQEVVLNQALIDLFKRIRSRPVVDSKYVFIWQDWSGNWTPVRSVKTAFKTACKAAGIPYGRNIKDGVTFHTLRHTYGSHLVMRGASIYEVQDLMRHADVKTTSRYAHLDDKTRQQAAARLNGLTG